MLTGDHTNESVLILDKTLALVDQTISGSAVAVSRTNGVTVNVGVCVGGVGEAVRVGTAVFSNNGVAVVEGVGNGRSVGGADVVVDVGVGEETAVAHPITLPNNQSQKTSHTPLRIITPPYGTRGLSLSLIYAVV